jgi:glycosyltransferase involved in cell wall biosynthesis
MHRKEALTVVYVIPSTEISGGTYVAWEHAARLAKRGHRVLFAVVSGARRRLDWLPDCRIPLVGLDEIPRDTDALIATWWETAYAVAALPARAKFFLIQSIEPRFYEEQQKAERIFSSLAYRFDYHFITVARWLADWLRDTYRKEVCLVQNQLNTELFHPVEPSARVPDPLMKPQAHLHMTVRSALPTEGHLFWDDGEGFVASRHLAFDLSPEWSDRCVILEDIPRLHTIRIDAGSLDGNTVEFSSLCLCVPGGERIDLLKKRCWKANAHVAEVSMRGGILTVRSRGDDPYLVLSSLRNPLRRLHPLRTREGERRMRILVEGPMGITFKRVKTALRLARETGCGVWFVDGKAHARVFDRSCPDRVFNQVPLPAMKYIYAGCDILLKLSTVESFAYPPLEMMACGGIPVVGDVEGIREYMVDAYNGCIVDTEDEEQIRRALLTVIGDGDLRERLKNGCRETVLKHSRWEPQIDALEKFLCEKAAAPTRQGSSRSFSLSEREIIDLYEIFIRRREGGGDNARREA